jgi:hypothetical protein
MSLRLGRVVDVHPEDNSVDVVMIEDGTRIAGVQVLTSSATSNTGTHDMPTVERPTGADKWDMVKPTGRDMIAVVGSVGRSAVVVGFLFPQVSQMLFKDKDRRVTRHSSDVYSTVDGAGNTELYHPSGTYLRIGTSPDHEDLAGKDSDGGWSITKNTGAAVHVRLQVANGGAPKATLTIDPSGNVTLEHTGNLVVNAGGTMQLTSAGNMTLTAPRIDLNP